MNDDHEQPPRPTPLPVDPDGIPTGLPDDAYAAKICDTPSCHSRSSVQRVEGADGERVALCRYHGKHLMGGVVMNARATEESANLLVQLSPDFGGFRDFRHSTSGWKLIRVYALGNRPSPRRVGRCDRRRRRRGRTVSLRPDPAGADTLYRHEPQRISDVYQRIRPRGYPSPQPRQSRFPVVGSRRHCQRPVKGEEFGDGGVYDE